MHQLRTLLLPAAVSVALLACGASFGKISQGRAEDMQTIGPDGGGPCLQVWIDNADPTRSQGAKDALAATCEIIQSPELETALNAVANWSTGSDHGGDVQPSAVRSDVMSLKDTPVHLIVGPVANANATSLVAVSETSGEAVRKAGPGARPAMNVDPERIDFWQSTDKRIRACLVDTLAHELTHLVPVQTGSVEAKYQDRSHEDRDHKASYAFGHAVGCLYMGLPVGCAAMKDCPGT